MADAYGTMIVCGDYKGDIDGVVSALNSVNWNTSDVKFRQIGDEVEPAEGVVEYPTVFPKREIIVLDDGRRCFADEADKSIVKKWKAGEYDSDEPEPYSLEQLSDLISPFLTKGTIELVAVAAEKLKYVYHERLVIRSDGSAERHMHQSESESRYLWNHEGSERYDPRAKKRPRAKTRSRVKKRRRS